MPSIYLCIDFGSTYTKAVAIDSNNAEIVARMNIPTTQKNGLQEGHLEILTHFKEKCGIGEKDYLGKFACSSAAGGLRMMVSGLVPKLTTEAAKRAALGAGAKVVRIFSYELTHDDITMITKERPDIFLISGGLDGGEKQTAIHNSMLIAKNVKDIPVVYAGNRNAIDAVREQFSQEEHRLFIADNVLASMDEVNVSSAQELIRKIFLKQIVNAKGLNLVQSQMDRGIIPTPSAVLRAAEHVSDTVFATEKGVMLIDPGGATTDVHSIAPTEPSCSGRILKGLPEKRVKRTVEADLGVRENVKHLIEEVKLDPILNLNGMVKGTFSGIIDKFHAERQCIPADRQEKIVDLYLARAAVEIATQRHVGMIKKVWLPGGEQVVQYGKDFSELSVVIGTGGVVIKSVDPRFVLNGATADETNVTVLKPRSPKLFLDTSYILFAIGMLAESDPRLASGLAQRYIELVASG
jgi:uncharacterized protein (TIGR01319 family)